MKRLLNSTTGYRAARRVEKVGNIKKILPRQPAIIRSYDDKELAEKYHIYRPTYPSFIADNIFNFMESGVGAGEFKQYGRMLDVACGSGLATRIFAPYFDDILGIDISPGQVEIAKKENAHKNVRFELVNDCLFPAKDGTVDLVTCATAVHFLNLETFLAECERVLKPSGCVAVFSHFPFTLRASSGRTIPEKAWLDILLDFYKTCRGYESNIRHYDRYKWIYEQIPNASKRWIENPTTSKTMTIADVKNIWSTLGEYHILMKEHRPDIDPLETFGNRLKLALSVEDLEDEEVEIGYVTDYPTIAYRSGG